MKNRVSRGGQLLRELLQEYVDCLGFEAGHHQTRRRACFWAGRRNNPDGILSGLPYRKARRDSRSIRARISGPRSVHVSSTGNGLPSMRQQSVSSCSADRSEGRPVLGRAVSPSTPSALNRPTHDWRARFGVPRALTISRVFQPWSERITDRRRINRRRSGSWSAKA